MQLKPSERLAKHFQSYAEYHRHPVNRLSHYFGIPMIMITLLGLLARIELGPLDLGRVLLVLATLYYLYLDWKIAVPFTLVSVGSYLLGQNLSISVCWVVFVLGWVFQFIGHYVFEKKSPAFFDNLLQLLVGPLWVFAKAIGYAIPKGAWDKQ